MDINLTEMGLSKLGEGLFKNCKKLVEVIVPNSEALNFIPKESFYYSGVKEITISKNILEVGDRAFSNCDSLIKIDVSDFEAVPN
ncbi:MAG: leucine-rich repeat domain-containing protein [Mycoplasmoidaceae bacterium]|nr:leucine-rich repeat domain-containing protein [Mycoplasmoidaceae bacterium]